ncbi:hypothetical protein D3C81_1343930 [compost metagenome]
MDEVMLVEAAQLFGTHATGHGRDVVDVRFSDHGSHGGGYVAGVELVTHVFVPEIGEVVVRPQDPTQCGNGPFVSQQRRRLVIVMTVGASKGVIHSRVNVEFDTRLILQSLLDRGPSLGGTELILFGHMEHQTTL